jgi:hypothetical protein
MSLIPFPYNKPAPVLATADVGQGRTLALLTDSAWNWGLGAAGTGDDGRAFQRFWEGAIRVRLLHTSMKR